MKKSKFNLKSFIFGTLCGVLFLNLGLEASNIFVSKAEYNDTKIEIDGKPIQLKNPCVSIVPSNSTTGYMSNYLPIRDIGEALGYEVSWEGETNTVKLDIKNENINKDSEKVKKEDLTSKNNKKESLDKYLEKYIEKISVWKPDDQNYNAWLFIYFKPEYSLLEAAEILLNYELSNEDLELFIKKHSSERVNTLRISFDVYGNKDKNTGNLKFSTVGSVNLWNSNWDYDLDEPVGEANYHNIYNGNASDKLRKDITRNARKEKKLIERASSNK